jgi:hypothetical protein
LNEDSLLGPHPLWTLEKIKNTLELGDDDEDAEVCRRHTMKGQGDTYKVVFALLVTDTEKYLHIVASLCVCVW